MDPLIREAIARRAPGGSIYVGGPTPASQQVQQPTGTTPAGGPNTPTTPPPQAPATPQPSAQIGKVGKVVRAGQAVNGPGFDDDTRRISKILMTQLIKYI